VGVWGGGGSERGKKTRRDAESLKTSGQYWTARRGDDIILYGAGSGLRTTKFSGWPGFRVLYGVPYASKFRNVLARRGGLCNGERGSVRGF